MGRFPAGAGALVGKRLGSHEIVALLAVGGTAEIYLARVAGAAGFEKYVVVKCLHDHLAEDPDFVHMFLDEARLGAQLEHSNVVQTLALGEQDGRYYLVMEFLSGLALSVISRRSVDRVPGGRVPVPLVIGIAAQACTALHYAHERTSGGVPLQLVHRDISPQNLVIGFEGVVKLVDFGIAKSAGRATKTQAGTIKGKFAYMSPEQCLSQDVDRRADVFALGVVVHELLTGKRLFKRGSAYDTYQAILEGKVPPPSTVNRALDPELDPVVMKALAYQRDDRYPSAEAFGEALIGYLHRHGGHASAGDIARYLEQYFAAEIDEHVARMRALIAGRETRMSTWDGEVEGMMMADADADATPVEEIVFDAAREDEGGEATRIETSPLGQLLADAVDVSARAATTPDPPRAPTSSGDYSLIVARPTTASGEYSVARRATTGGLRDLGPRAFPSAPVPTVITAEPSLSAASMPPPRLMTAADAPTMLNMPSPFASMPTPPPTGTPAGMSPASTGAYAPPISANPPGAPPMADLPLPAHLIGLPVSHEPERAPTAIPVDLSTWRGWLLVLAFVISVAVALAATIGLARALT